MQMCKARWWTFSDSGMALYRGFSFVGRNGEWTLGNIP
jgi:hypothetical protein